VTLVYSRADNTIAKRDVQSGGEGYNSWSNDTKRVLSSEVSGKVALWNSFSTVINPDILEEFQVKEHPNGSTGGGLVELQVVWASLEQLIPSILGS